MSDRLTAVTLRVEPRTIPTLVKAYEDALFVLGSHLNRLEQEGYLRDPWLGDEISAEVRNFYNNHVMDRVDGPYGALLRYQTELTRIYDTLKYMEEEYRRSEGDNAELWGRL
jgi:hypothetical protein